MEISEVESFPPNPGPRSLLPPAAHSRPPLTSPPPAPLPQGGLEREVTGLRSALQRKTEDMERQGLPDVALLLATSSDAL
jgi:hypothetical protein